MLKNLLIALGITIVALLALNDTLNHFKETENVAITTPAQMEMRTPAKQNPGQRSTDIHTEKIRNRENEPDFNTNPNNNANKFDNFNRNRNRDNIRQYFNKPNRNTKDMEK